MSKKSTKKLLKNSKEKPKLQIYIWADVSVTPNQSSWDNQYAIQYLQTFDLTKSWKGKFFIYSESIAIRSKNKMFSQVYDVKNVIGYLESPYNKKIILIGILDESMAYLLIQCHDIPDKLKIIKELNAYKSSNEITNSTERLDSQNNIVLPSTNQAENATNFINSENDINRLSNYETYIDVQPKEHVREEISLQSSFVPIKDEIFTTKKIPAVIMNTELVDNTIDSFQAESTDSNSDNVIWIENTKYIDYVSSLGMHVQTDDGSIYMYCAHQVVPRIDEYYSDDSDSN